MNAINKLKRISEIESELKTIQVFTRYKEFGKGFTIGIVSYNIFGDAPKEIEIKAQNDEIGKEFAVILEKYAHELWVERDTLVDQYLDYIANQTLPRV